MTQPSPIPPLTIGTLDGTPVTVQSPCFAMGSFLHLHWLHNDLIASQWQLPFNKVGQIARKFLIKWEPEGPSWAIRALCRWYTRCIPISSAGMGPQAGQVLGAFMMTNVAGPLYMASAHGFVPTGSFDSHLGGIFHAVWSTSLKYLTHGNRKTTRTLTIDAISLLNYCQLSLSTRTHTGRQANAYLACYIPKESRITCVPTVVLYNQSPTTFLKRMSRYIPLIVCQYTAKKPGSWLTFPVTTQGCPLHLAGLSEWHTWPLYYVRTAAWWPLCAERGCRQMYNKCQERTIEEIPCGK